MCTVSVTPRLDAQRLLELGEYFAGGYFGSPDPRHVVRVAAGLRSVYEHTPLHVPAEALLLPAGPSLYPAGQAVYYFYGNGIVVDYGTLDAKRAAAESEADRELLSATEEHFRGYADFGWQGHSIPSFERVLAEGLDGIEARIRRRRAEELGQRAAPASCHPERSEGSPEPADPAAAKPAEMLRCAQHDTTPCRPERSEGSPEPADPAAARPAEMLRCARHDSVDDEAVGVYDALLVLLEGIRALSRRCAEAARAQAQQATSQAEAQRWGRMAEALARVPWQPAQSFAEAVLATNFVLYLDNDDLGRVDQYLYPHYEADVASGAISDADVEPLLDELWHHVNDIGGWNAAIGGTRPDGSSAVNALTYHCLRATPRVARIRPNLALRVSRRDPDELLEAALDTIATGCGMPALYNEERYQEALLAAHVGLSPQDAREFAFGGCTEIMIHGRSNCGSLDASFSALQHLEYALNDGVHRQSGERRGEPTGRLSDFATFEQLVEALKQQLRAGIRQTVEMVNRFQERRAALTPCLVRTLLIDDCVERGREFHAGGARYNWSVVSIAGLANVADALAAVKHVIFDRGEATLAELEAALAADFEGYEELHRKLRAAPRYGNDHELPDGLMKEVAEFIFREFPLYAPWRGGRFLCSCIMFTTYAMEGAPIGATPDGRRSGDPVVDSIGPVAGADRQGPTAFVNSVTKLDHGLAPGTLILNLRLMPEMVRRPEERRQVIRLLRSYFQKGGMQIQINVADQQVLLDARAHPERYQNLIIRVGGFSDYFVRLDPVLQETIIQRVAHE